MNQKQYLNDNWSFTLKPIKAAIQSGTKIHSKYLKTYPAQIPGTIHTDLLSNGLIDDPFYADNELSLQWISGHDWEYETTFTLSKDFDLTKPVYLVFAGLDTVADVFVNKKLVGSTVNMFRSHRFKVNNFLKGKNNLKVVFHSPVAYAKQQEEKYGKIPVSLRSERVYIRKAQYSFGWDWGPTFITSGIWKPVWLENQTGLEITDINFITKSLNEKSATCRIEAAFSQKLKAGYKVKVELEIEDEEVYAAEIPAGKLTGFHHEFNLRDPKIWNPNGSGEQHLHTLTITVLDGETVVAVSTKRVGVRTISLQLTDKNGKTFRFIVNGKPVFMKGVDWIPSNSFLPEVKETVYRDLLEKAQHANMNMVRVWGGGVYEQDVFYDLCDELGLLVWQDFMFACASYPEHPSFLTEVKKEVEENVLRLRAHACIALWCGNNENEWIWFQQQKSDYKNMPGHKIFSEYIPGLVKALVPQQPYWVSSPFGDGEDPNAMENGNRHQWDIWSRWIDYGKVVEDTSRFVTEFGFQGPANRLTLEHAIPPAERSIQSRLFEFHNKQVEGNERVIKFLAGHLPLRTEWKDFLYLAQLNQGLALKACLEHWRANAPQTNGSLIWQLNDCWPVTSWAIVDSSLAPKLSYHFVRRAFAPVQISFRNREGNYEIVAANSTGEEVKGTLEIIRLNSSSAAIKKVLNVKVKLSVSESQQLAVLPDDITKDQENVFIATLRGQAGEIISRNYLTLQPWKYLRLPKAGLKVGLSVKDGETRAKVQTKQVAFFVDIEIGGAELSDRGFILLPDETVTLTLKGNKKNAKPIPTCLNDYL